MDLRGFNQKAGCQVSEMTKMSDFDLDRMSGNELHFIGEH